MKKHTTRREEQIYYTVPLQLWEKLQRTKDFVNKQFKERFL